MIAITPQEPYKINDLLSDLQFGYTQLPSWVVDAIAEGKLIILPTTIKVLTPACEWVVAKSSGSITAAHDGYVNYLP